MNRRKQGFNDEVSVLRTRTQMVDQMSAVRPWGLRAFAFALAVLSVVMFAGERAEAGMVSLGSQSGSGTNGEGSNSVSGSVTFYYNSAQKNQLVIDIFNTTSGGTIDSADVLVGLAFKIAGVTKPTLTDKQFVSPSLTTQLGTSAELGGSGGDLDFVHTWKTGSPVGSNLGDFGVSTNGFNGAFNGQGLNNQNNGLVALGTSLSNGGLHAHTPYAENGLEITLLFGPSADFSDPLLRITNVELLFGTSGQGVINAAPLPPPNPVPEPSTIALLCVGTAGLLGFVGLRRFKVSAAEM
jgi:hypothetical protein